MENPTPASIVASLSPAQRDIILCGPERFEEADAIPDGLFEMDLIWDRETGDESFFWELTDLGRQVRDLLD